MPDQSVGTPTSSFGSTSQTPMGLMRFDHFLVDGLINLYYVESGGLSNPRMGSRIWGEIYEVVINSRLQAHRDLFDRKTTLRERLGFAVVAYVKPHFPDGQFFNAFDVMKKLDELNEALQTEIQVLLNILTPTQIAHSAATPDDVDLSISVSTSCETLSPVSQEEESEGSLSRENSVDTLIGSVPITPLNPNQCDFTRFFRPSKKFRSVGTTTWLDLNLA